MSRRFFLYATVLWFTLAGCSESKKEPAASSSSPSFDEVLTSRRSVRSYDATKKILEEEVRELLAAVQEAPSWANQQPTKYYVAISPEKLAAVQDLVGGNKDRIDAAPVLIVSTYERGKSGFFQGKAEVPFQATKTFADGQEPSILDETFEPDSVSDVSVPSIAEGA